MSYHVCLRPIEAVRFSDGSVVILGSSKDTSDAQGFAFKSGLSWERLQLRCRVCANCRLAHVAMWTTRLLHERSQHDHALFITLTYSDEHLPVGRSLDHRDIQLFMKRLRFAIKKPVRYFVAGEYGEKTQRPHYHMILFGHLFTDGTPVGRTPQGHQLYSSPSLLSYWEKGKCDYGICQEGSIDYTVKYSTKRLDDKGNVRDKAAYWTFLDETTGEITKRRREYIRMSVKPGIGATWFDQYKSDLLKGYVVVDGHKRAIPQYYLDRWAKDPEDSEELEQLLLNRSHYLKDSEKPSSETLSRRDSFSQTVVQHINSKRTFE